ncbi:MAG: hypothetical protein WB729_24385 [Candidatus Sulfotelmatobacter sp.]
MSETKRHRTSLPAISEEMKAWSAALAAEMSNWPNVTLRPFFGFNALYRKEKLFGLLPRTRGMQTANSLVFKLESPRPQALARMRQDSRVGAAIMQKARWFTFELTTDADLRDALHWQGYDAAGKRKKRA